jgi:site-specific recombinase XerD
MHEDFLTSLVQDGKSKNTLDSFRNVSCKYFLFLESLGVTSLESATKETVQGFLSCIRETWAEGSLRTALSALRSLFRHTGQADLLETADHIRPIRTHRIIPVLTEQEECLLWNALEKSGDISKRDKAIVLLCLITGLRACDVTRLRTSDINWHTDTISVVQQKTGNPLSIPLLPALGNAIAEYMISERPANREEILFLSKNGPHGPLAGHTPCRAIILRTLRIAGISLDGRICGTRLLRHNAASKMLRSEIPIETISAVLGHSAPDSTEIYLATDESRMRECCLSIPNQPNMEDEKR